MTRCAKWSAPRNQCTSTLANKSNGWKIYCTRAATRDGAGITGTAVFGEHETIRTMFIEIHSWSEHNNVRLSDDISESTLLRVTQQQFADDEFFNKVHSAYTLLVVDGEFLNKIHVLGAQTLSPLFVESFLTHSIETTEIYHKNILEK